MKEVCYWEAKDGTRFESEWECEKHEERLRFRELLAAIPCYNAHFERISAEDESIDVDDVYYVLIPDVADGEFFTLLSELDEDYFTGDLPFDEANSQNDLLYYDEDSDSWHVWSGEFSKLEQLKNYFQLFGKKGE